MSDDALPTCRACDRTVRDGSYVCITCARRVERDLGDMTWLAEQLEITITRQDRMGGMGTGIVARSAEKPVAFNAHASAVAGDLRGVLVAWCLLICEERGQATPADTLAAMGVFLLGSVEWLRHHPAGDEAFDELGDAIRRARSAVDRRPDRVYVGPCDRSGVLTGVTCPEDLYARPGAAEVECKTCGSVWQVTERREWLLEVARDTLATAADLARLLSLYGEPLRADRIWKWAERGRIVPHGNDGTGRPMYRVGEVADLLAATLAEKKGAPCRSLTTRRTTRPSRRTS